MQAQQAHKTLTASDETINPMCLGNKADEAGLPKAETAWLRSSVLLTGLLEVIPEDLEADGSRLRGGSGKGLR